MYPGFYDPSKGMQSLDPFAGMPEELRDLDLPPFMRNNYRRQSTADGLVAAVQEQLREGKKTYIRGGDGVWVSKEQFEDLSARGIVITGEGSTIINMPSPEDVTKIFEEAYRTVDDNMPGDYKAEAREKLKGIEPKFAGTLEEAAAAFGQTLPTPPQE